MIRERRERWDLRALVLAFAIVSFLGHASAQVAPEPASAAESASAPGPAAAPEPASEPAPVSEPASEPAAAPEPAVTPPVRHEPDTRLSGFRTPFEALSERTIGRTARPVRFDWRQTKVQFGLLGGIPAELNNYNSLRAGGVARVPAGGTLIAVGLSKTWVMDTPSSRRLALTPYRQPGRPDRLELDVTLRYPLAEGIVTAVPAFMPATELVFSLAAELRYLIYTGAYSGLKPREKLRSVFSPSLSGKEIENLEDDRLPGMQVDRARLGLLTGLATDLYFQSGMFVSAKYLVAVPALIFMTQTEMGFGFELDLSVGFSLRGAE